MALPKTKLYSAVEKRTAVDKMIHVKDYLQDMLLSWLKFFVPHLRFQIVMSQDYQEKKPPYSKCLTSMLFVLSASYGEVLIERDKS